VGEAVVGRGVEIGVVAAVVVVPVRARTGLDLALGIAAVGGELREQDRVGRPGPCWVFSIRLASSYLPLGAVAVVEVIGEDAPVIRIHFPSFLLNAT